MERARSSDRPQKTDRPFSSPSHPQVTILFTDIVGFTAMSRVSLPYEVMEHTHHVRCFRNSHNLDQLGAAKELILLAREWILMGNAFEILRRISSAMSKEWTFTIPARSSK